MCRLLLHYPWAIEAIQSICLKVCTTILDVKQIFSAWILILYFVALLVKSWVDSHLLNSDSVISPNFLFEFAMESTTIKDGDMLIVKTIPCK